MFEGLSEKSSNLIIRLPYRVGLYVSESDADGGDDSSVKERRVLSNLLHGFGQDVVGAELTYHLVRETLALHEEWDSWETDLEYVPAECQEALELLEEYVPEKDRRSFAAYLYEIAEAVALAFKEYQGDNFIGEIKLYLQYRRDQAQARKVQRREITFDEYKSISEKERMALDSLARGLGLVS